MNNQEIFEMLRQFFLSTVELENLTDELRECHSDAKRIEILKTVSKISKDRVEAARFLRTNIHKIELAA